MGRHYHYRMGQFYRVDDRTGFPQYADDTRREWNGLIVDKSVWEARQPQDLVRGVKDEQAAPDPRPLAPNQFVGPTYTSLTVSYYPSSGGNRFEVSSVAGMQPGMAIGIMQDNGAIFYTGIMDYGYPGDPNAVFVYGQPTVPASAGNMVIIYGVPFTGPTVGLLGTENHGIIATESGAEIGL